MKRSAILQPLSREHHTALSLAKSCERAVQSGDMERIRNACQRAVRAFEEEMEQHFRIEEQTYLPLLHNAGSQSLVQRTLADHHQIRALLDGLRQNDAQSLALFGKCLSEHVRFEERELFQALESLLPADQ